MKYIYQCPECQSETIITKSISEVDRPERCTSCVVDMKRQLSASYFHFQSKNEYIYQPAFGTYTRTSRDIKQEIYKFEDKTGRKIEEVGNDIPTGNGPIEHKIDMQDTAEHFRQLVKQENRKETD